MPYQIEDIRYFNKGFVTNVDEADVDINTAVLTQNVDSQAPEGILRGIEDTTVYTSSGNCNFIKGAIIQSEGGTNTFVYKDNTHIRASDKIIDTPNGTNGLINQSLATTTASSFNSLNDACYIGNGNNTPIWAGYLKDGAQFNGSITFNGTGSTLLNIDISDSKLSTPATVYITMQRTGQYSVTDFQPQPNSTLGDYFYVSNESYLPRINDKILFSYTAQYENNSPSNSLNLWYVSSVHIETETENYYFTLNSAINGSGFFLNISSSGGNFQSGYFKYTYPDYVIPTTGVNFANFKGVTKYTISENSNSISWYNVYNIVNNNVEYLYPSFDIYKDEIKTFNLSSPNAGKFFKYSFTGLDTIAQGDRYTVVINSEVNTFLIESNTMSSPKIYIDRTASVFQGTNPTFTASKSIIYGWSFIYDYVSETTITYNKKADDQSSIFTPTGDKSSHTFIFTLDSQLINKRITGMNVYMAECDANNTEPDGYFRLIKSVQISPNKEWILTGGTIYKMSITNEKNITNSYEAQTGISQDLETNIVNYTYATKYDSYLYVTKCYHKDLPQGERIVLRSKAGRFNTFDWSKDFLVLDFVPVGIQAVFGKVFVFGKHKTVKLNADNFFIEDTLDGIGLINSECVDICEMGMFWADNNHAYHFDGNKVNVISTPIEKEVSFPEPMNTYSIKSWGDSEYKPDICVIDYARRIVNFINKTNDFIFLYDIDRQRWDTYFDTNLNLIGYTRFLDGKLYINNGSNIVVFKDNTTKKSFYFYSKKLDFESLGLDKRLRRIKVHYNGTVPTIQYSIDGTSWENYTINDANPININKKFKKLQLSINGQSDTEIYSVSIIYRPLRLK